jgi:hypothetical protein
MASVVIDDAGGAATRTPAFAGDRVGNPPCARGAAGKGAEEPLPSCDPSALPPPIGVVAESYGSDVTPGCVAVRNGPPESESGVSWPNIGTVVCSFELGPREEDALGGGLAALVPR